MGSLIRLHLKATTRLCNMTCCLIRLYRLDIKVELICYTCRECWGRKSLSSQGQPDPQPLLSVAREGVQGRMGCREEWRTLGPSPGHDPSSCSLFWSVISGDEQRREKETLLISSFLQHSNDSTSSEADGAQCWPPHSAPVCPLVARGQSLFCPPFLGNSSSL